MRRGGFTIPRGSGGMIPGGGLGLVGVGRRRLPDIIGGLCSVLVVAGLVVVGGGAMARDARAGDPPSPTATATAETPAWTEPSAAPVPTPTSSPKPKSASLPAGYSLKSEPGARMDSCRSIRYRLVGGTWPADGETAASKAIAQVSDMTGLTFVQDDAARAPGTVARPAVTIALVPERDDPELSGDTVGYAWSHWEEDGSGAYLTGGPVVIEEELLDTWPGETKADRRVATTKVIVHELGHILGLAHVTTRASIMNPEGGPKAPTKDDKRAFAFVGSGPCR